MRGLAAVGAIALSFVACTAAPDEPPIGQSAQAIIGGTTSPSSQDATVLLSERGYPSCTAVLIAPNLVLTARHCVTDINYRSECGGPLGRSAPPTALTVSVGAYTYPDDYVARGTRLFVPDADHICGADIALVLLDNDVKGVTPVKVRFTGPALGDVTTAVGYGDNSGSRDQRTDVRVLAIGPSQSTYRTQGGYPIAMNIMADEISTSESTCFGDSGGPLFDAEGRVVGVASRGLDDRCRDRPTVWTTFGGHAQLIKDAAVAAGHPIQEESASTSTSGSTSVAGGRTPTETEEAKRKKSEQETTAKKGTNDLLGSDGCNASSSSPTTAAPLLAALAFTLHRRRTRRRANR
ncbi:MAG: trypsin-like serine protease [Labilithrix sp.]|nr:trypsin-like serine protease [Labilithrix sp.]MCW5813826.1 trypsin-like serine protease [Labilithrix sp.]